MRSRIAAAKTRQQDGTYVVRSGNAKNALFTTRIEGSGQHEFFHHRQHPVEFPQNFAPTQSELETTRRAHQQVVSKHDSGALQGAADGRLAQHSREAAAVMLFSSAITAKVMRRFRSTCRSFSRRMAAMNIMHESHGHFRTSLLASPASRDGESGGLKWQI